MKSLHKLRYLKYGDMSVVPVMDGRIAVLDEENIVVKICSLPEGWVEWKLGSLHAYIKDQLGKPGVVEE